MAVTSSSNEHPYLVMSSEHPSEVSQVARRSNIPLYTYICF